MSAIPASQTVRRRTGRRTRIVAILALAAIAVTVIVVALIARGDRRGDSAAQPRVYRAQPQYIGGHGERRGPLAPTLSQNAPANDGSQHPGQRP
jgi:hypothetical protein